jgi:hypothetical protein
LRGGARATTAATAPPVVSQEDAKVLLPAAKAPIDDYPVANAQASPATRLAHPPPAAVPILLGKQSFLV